MPPTKLQIGDRIRVIGYRPGVYAPEVEDEMGTEALFRHMVGRRYTVRGFDEYGKIELRPRHGDTVWIEPDLVKPVGKAARRMRGEGDGLGVRGAG